MQEAAKKQLLKSTDSEKELLIWGIPIEKVDEMAALGIPLAASGDIGISEVFNPKKTHPDFVFPWVGATPVKDVAAMPEEVVICLKKVKGVHFDLLVYNNFFIVSEKLYEYMVINGFNYENGKSVAHILDTKGKKLTEEKFYLLRFYWWEITTEEVGIFTSEDESSHPRAITHSSKNFLMTTQLGYENELFVNKQLKEDIEAKFKNPTLYTMKEWEELNKEDWEF